MRRIVKDGKEYIFDVIRKKNVVLTPEEWVRQQIIHYLVFTKHYPAALFSVEKQINIGKLRKRYDLVIYKQDLPWLILECKSETEKLDTSTIQQIIAYNTQLQAKYLALSNGIETMIYDVVNDAWTNQFPEYST